MRILSFAVAAVAVLMSLTSLYQLGSGQEGLVLLAGSLQAAVAFLLCFGGSELINVVLDIEKNTRRGLEETETPDASS